MAKANQRQTRQMLERLQRFYRLGVQIVADDEANPPTTITTTTPPTCTFLHALHPSPETRPISTALVPRNRGMVLHRLLGLVV